MTIKEIREMTGLSQKEFSKVFNIPVRTIQNWEENKRKPPEYINELLELKVWMYKLNIVDIIVQQIKEQKMIIELKQKPEIQKIINKSTSN